MLAALIGPAEAQHPEIAQRRALERKIFSNAEIIVGFFRVTLGAELDVAGGDDRVRKYQGPIPVYIDNRANPDRSEQIAAVVADIRARIRDIDLATSSRRSDANSTPCTAENMATLAPSPNASESTAVIDTAGARHSCRIA